MTLPSLHVLLVEDNPADANLVRELLDHTLPQSFITHATRLGTAIECLAAAEFDAILLDLSLPDAREIEAVARLHATAPNLPLVILSGQDDENVAITGLQLGAQDYLRKGELVGEGLVRSLRYAIERVRQATALRLSEERFRALSEHATDLVVVVDTQGIIHYASPSHASIVGYTPAELQGQRVLDHVFPDDMGSMQVAFRGCMGQVGMVTTAVLRLRHRDGSWRTVESVLHNRLDDPAVRGIIVTSRDVTARQAMEASLRASEEILRQQALHDPLTGLPNRRLLYDRLEQALLLGQRTGNRTALLFLDLDGFKAINDGLGHDVGDELLQKVARCLVACMRASDTVARLGGDEFTVLMPNVTSPNETAIVAGKILKAVHDTWNRAGHEIPIGVSIGISLSPDDGRDAKSLVKAADDAMYQAKRDGKNRYVFAGDQGNNTTLGGHTPLPPSGNETSPIE